MSLGSGMVVVEVSLTIMFIGKLLKVLRLFMMKNNDKHVVVPETLVAAEYLPKNR